MNNAKSLKKLNFDIHYEGSASYLYSFLIPALGESLIYKRATGYFNVESLISVSHGLETMLLSGGKMQLLIGMHDLSDELVQAQKASKLDRTPEAEAEASARLNQIVQEIGSLRDALKLKRLETLTSLISGGHLSIKLAKPIGVSSHHIFHVKRFVLEDINGDFVCATGSPNETSAGSEGNFEEISTFKSWDDLSGHARELKRKFDSLWLGQNSNLEITELADADLELLQRTVVQTLRSLGVDSKSESKSKKSFLDSFQSFVPAKIFQFKGARLFPHQEFAYLKALSRWPIRVLLADEVGLGKTLEVGSTLRYLKDVGHLQTAVFLAPKNVVFQLQAELFEKFNLEFLVWNSNRQCYVDVRGEIADSIYGPPGRKDSPDWVLASSQWARGSGLREHIFKDMEKYPDILIVDEAHAARVPAPEQNSSPSLLYKALQDACTKIPHVILMTATPMQLHVSEYHGLLRLLGLPKTWQRLKHFELALTVQAKEQVAMSLNEGKDVALMLFEAKALIPELISQKPEGIDASNIVELANQLRRTWVDQQEEFVRLNPATQLTVRNTRQSLEKFGYTFPERNFLSPELNEPLSLSEIRFSLNEYLSSAYGKFEELLNSDLKAVSKGFVTSIYEQRFASSLWALTSSLSRRRAKLEALYSNSIPSFEFDDDDFLEDGDDEQDADYPENLALNGMLKSALQNEINYVDDVLSQIDSIKSGPILGDPKLKEANRIIANNVAFGKRIIVFSRYTDTLVALLQNISEDASLKDESFGFYSGQECWIQKSGLKGFSTKSQLQKALANGEINFVLCSDAASEGINLQTASVLINVDVPWNPGRLEQRIGRIARLGQKAKVVDIANLWYPNSVESVMYGRLLERKELYDLAVGAFPDLFSKGIREMVNLQSGAKMSYSGDVLEKLEELRERSHLDGLSKLWESSKQGASKSKSVWNELGKFFSELGLAFSENEGIDLEQILNIPSNFGSISPNARLMRCFNEYGTWGYSIEMLGSGERFTFNLGSITQLFRIVFGDGVLRASVGTSLADEWVPNHTALALSPNWQGAKVSDAPNSSDLQEEEIGKIQVTHEDSI
jgi:SNF2 family DNA or RNA helicase